MSKFKELAKKDCSGKVEKKGNFSYLSWAWAWDMFVREYPDAKYEIVKNENNLPYFKDDGVGGMVYTRVTAGSITHEMWLPIMDYKNKAKKQFDMMDVNKTIMRCLVKNLAMFGLGLYIYAGEDLPNEEEEPASKEQILEIEKLLKETSSDIGKFMKVFKIQDLSELTNKKYEKAKEILLKKKEQKNENN